MTSDAPVPSADKPHIYSTLISSCAIKRMTKNTPQNMNIIYKIKKTASKGFSWRLITYAITL